MTHYSLLTDRELRAEWATLALKAATQKLACEGEPNCGSESCELIRFHDLTGELARRTMSETTA